jgi:ribosomal-protein-alanine N-acetyltransferase
MTKSGRLRGNFSIGWSRIDPIRLPRLSEVLKMDWNRVSVQKMDIKDLDEVCSIEVSQSLTPWSKNIFTEEMGNTFAYCFVIKRKDEVRQSVIGYLCFRNMADESELLNIGVHPDQQRVGIGKKLMQFYIDLSRQRGAKTFYLEVNPSNLSAIHLYQSFSYQSSGTRKRFYDGKFDALLMVKKV